MDVLVNELLMRNKKYSTSISCLVRNFAYRSIGICINTI